MYCTVPYCKYCTVLHCTVLYGTVRYGMVLYGTVRYCTVLFCTVLIWFSPCLRYTYGYTVTQVRLFTANHKKPNLLTRQLIQEFHQSHTQLSWEWFNIVKYLSAALLQTLLEAHRFLLKFMAVSCWLLLIPLSLWTQTLLWRTTSLLAYEVAYKTKLPSWL